MTFSRKGLMGALVAATCTAGMAVAEPMMLRIGHGTAAEEQLWLMQAMPEIAPNLGTVYNIELTRFPGTDRRFQAFQGGALDFATASANSAIFAASEGVDMQIVASLSRESNEGFFTRYYVLEDSDIQTVADLRGRTIGINGFNSSIHLWAIKALEDAGLNPDRDVNFAVIRFPAQGEALRGGTVDVGAFPQPFAHIEAEQGGVRLLFTSKDAVPFDEELMLLLASPALLEEYPDVARAFLSDLVNATRFYEENPEAARTALVENGISMIPLQFYLGMEDYFRDPDARVDVEALEAMQDMQIEIGWQRQRVDIPSIVNMDFLPQ